MRFLFIAIFFVSSCQNINLDGLSVESNNDLDTPVSVAINPAGFNEDTESIITLSYTSSDIAASCALSNLSNIVETQACSCSLGTCSVGITGDLNYSGTASFEYLVTVDGNDSNKSTATLTINPVDDAPTTTNFTNPSLDEDTQEIISLAYDDVDFDLATTCSISSLSNITETQACTCAAGTCSVGVTGNSNYNGAAAFDFNVTANSVTSNTSTATLSISNVNDVPVLTNDCSSTATEDSAYSCLASATDNDSGDTQTYSLVSNTCSFISIVPSTGAISGTPANTDVGSCSFGVKSNDSSSDSNTQVVSITVNSAPTPMVTTWKMGTPGYGDGSLSLSLPLVNGYTYNFVVDWGDGTSSTVTSYNDPDATHIYSSAGDYTVTITGIAQAWRLSLNEDDNGKILTVVDLGSLGWVDLSYAFYECVNLTSFAGGDTSSVTSMNGMFAESSGITSLNVSSFDTANVTSMIEMFSGLSNLTALNITNFNTANVTNMSSMFMSMRDLTSLNLINFNTAKVTNMRSMFRELDSLTTLDLGSFNTSLVEDMSAMFLRLRSLTSLNISSFDTSSVRNMQQMFSNLENLVSLHLAHFVTSNVTDMSYMFYSMSDLTSLIITNFNTSNVTSMYQMFWGVSSLSSLNVSSFDTASVESMGGMFYNMSSLTSLDLSNFVATSVESMREMFSRTASLTTLNLPNLFVSASVVDMSGMFRGATSITSMDLSFFDTSSVEEFQNIFENTSSLVSLDLTGWSLLSLTDDTDAFSGKNASLTVLCDEGGTPGTGSILGEACN